MAYYFNNDYVEKKIMQYRKTSNVKYRNEAILEISKIVNAIINLYKYWRFEDRDVLESEGHLACLNALEKFDPERFKHKKDLAFRYFSLVVKKHLAFITLKETKFKTRNIFVEDKMLCNHTKSYNIFDKIEDKHELIHFLKQCLFHNLKKKLRIVSYLEKYIRLNQKFFDRRGFINYTKSFGVTQSYTRKILKEVEQSKELFEVYVGHIHSKSCLQYDQCHC